MQPWKISVGLTAIIMAGALMLAGEGFSWLRPYFWMALTDHWMPSHGTQGWPWPR